MRYFTVKTKVGMFLILLILGVVGIVSNNRLKDELHIATNKQLELQQKINMQNKQLNDFLKVSRENNELTYEKIKKQLNATIDMEFFINELMKIANTNFLMVSIIKPLTIFYENSFKIYPLEIVVNGKYKKLVIFINELKKLPYFLVVQKIKINRLENDKDILNMQLLLEIYSNKHD